jgi:hypothetical protein
MSGTDISQKNASSDIFLEDAFFIVNGFYTPPIRMVHLQLFFCFDAKLDPFFLLITIG